MGAERDRCEAEADSAVEGTADFHSVKVAPARNTVVFPAAPAEDSKNFDEVDV